MIDVLFAVFLNALLRNQQSTKLPSLFLFLEFEKHVKAATAAAQSGANNPNTLEEGGSHGASPWNMLSPDSPKGRIIDRALDDVLTRFFRLRW